MKKFLEMKIQIPPLAIQLEIMGKIGELQKNIDLAQLQVERLKKDAMAGFESNE